MNEMGLETVPRRKHIRKNYAPSMKYRMNVLKREFNPDALNKVWASDITYIYVNYKPHYLCIIADLFSRKVIAYTVSNKIDVNLTKDTFRKAYENRKPEKGLIFHSDQGLQYTAYEFGQLLKSKEIEQSFSNPGCPYDNAVLESFFKSLKTEQVYRQHYKNPDEMAESIDEYINFFNNERPHQRLHYKMPTQYEQEYFSA